MRTWKRQPPWKVTAFYLDKPPRDPEFGSLRWASSFETSDLSGNVLMRKFAETNPAPGRYLLIGGPGPVDNVNPVIVKVEPTFTKVRVNFD